MKRLLFGVLLLFFGAVSLSGASEPLSPLPFTRITRQSAPPSFPIAAPLSGGPLRVLFIGQREMLGFSWSEISSRLDGTFDTILTESRRELTPSPLPASPDSILFMLGSVENRASDLLGRPWDAIWLDFDFDALPETVRRALLIRVESGTGLVYVGKITDLKGVARPGKFERDLLRAVPFQAGSPEYAGERGKGTVLAFPEFDRRSHVREIGDYFTGAVHALFLASGRFRAFGVTGVQDSGKEIEHESMSIMNYRVEFRNDISDVHLSVKVRYRDENGVLVHESEDSYDIQRGRGFFRVTYPMLPLGWYSADISILENGKVIALAGKTFRVHSEDALEGIIPRNSTAQPGEFLTGRVRLSQEMEEGMVLVVELLDHLDRCVSRSELVPETRRKWEDYAFRATDDMDGMMRVRASLFKNNTCIHYLVEPVYIGKAEDSRRFSLIVSDRGAEESWRIPGLVKLVETGVRAFAMDTEGISPSEAGSAARAVYRAGGIPLPIVSGISGAGSGPDGEGKGAKHLFAQADTLLHLPISTCWVRTAADRDTRPAYRTAVLSELSGAGKRGDIAAALRSALPSELFFRGQSGYDPHELGIAPWRNLFLGIDAICWTGISGKVGDALLPGGEVNPAFSILAEQCRMIREGMDLLISGSRREERGITLVSPECPGAEAMLFRDGGIRYIGILPGSGRDADSTGFPAKVALGDAGLAHVYDILEGTYRGQISEISFAIRRGEAELFALLPYRVKDIDIRFAGGVVRADGKLDFEASIIPQEAGITPGRHVLSIRFIGPDGIERSRLRTGLEAPDGKVRSSFTLPFGAPQGKWMIQVRDVISGKKTERPFVIMPSGELTGN